jgi:hypothetical protein
MLGSSFRALTNWSASGGIGSDVCRCQSQAEFFHNIGYAERGLRKFRKGCREGEGALACRSLHPNYIEPTAEW